MSTDRSPGDSAADLRVVLFQLTSVDDVQKNLEQIELCLSQIPKGSVDLISLPENSLYQRIREGTSIPSLSLESDVFKKLAGHAKDLDATFHIGSVPTLSGDGRLFNTSVLITPDGGARELYKKIHLFDVDVEGHKPVRESDVFAPGEETSTFMLKGWKIGATICYDLRFAELYSIYAKQGVDVILIPASFLVPTGRAHWDVLTRARAIESQAFVLAAAQGGEHRGIHGGSRSTYGHSMIIDPWGEVLATLPDDFGERRILRAVLSRDRLRAVRQQIPMSRHRRL